MIYTDEEMTKEYDNFVIKRFDCDDDIRAYDDVKDSEAYDDDFDHDVEVEVKFTGPPRDLVLYIHPKCVHEKVLVRLITDFCFEGWPVGRSEITIMGGNVILFMDPKYTCDKTEKGLVKKHDIVEIITLNDANVTILDVPQNTKLSVFDESSVRVVSSNMDRAVVADSGAVVTKVPMTIIGNNQAKVIDLKHDGITDIDASDSVTVITQNNKINGHLHDDATLTFDEAGKPIKTYAKKSMTMHEFACYVAKKEKGKSQVNIGDIKEILKIVDNAVRGRLAKTVDNGVYVYDHE